MGTRQQSQIADARQPPQISSSKRRAIEDGIKGLNHIAQSRMRLSPHDDVDRSIERYVSSHSAFSPAELREIREVLLNYAFWDLHRERWSAADRTDQRIDHNDIVPTSTAVVRDRSETEVN